jgi:hypothetical protein
VADDLEQPLDTAARSFRPSAAIVVLVRFIRFVSALSPSGGTNLQQKPRRGAGGEVIIPD